MCCSLQVLELLAGHLAQWSCHVAFPELVQLPLLHLRRFAKASPVERFRKSAKQLVDAIERNVAWVGAARDRAEFGPKDTAKVSERVPEPAYSQESYTCTRFNGTYDTDCGLHPVFENPSWACAAIWQAVVGANHSWGQHAARRLIRYRLQPMGRWLLADCRHNEFPLHLNPPCWRPVCPLCSALLTSPDPSAAMPSGRRVFVG